MAKLEFLFILLAWQVFILDPSAVRVRERERSHRNLILCCNQLPLSDKMRSGWIRDLRTHATWVSHQHICSLNLIWTQLMKERHLKPKWVEHAGWYLHLPQPDLPELDMWTDCTQLHTDIRVIRKEEELRVNGLLCYDHITNIH